MKISLYRLNILVSFIMILFGLFLIIVTATTVTDMTPGYYGSSPKDTPYFVGISIIIFSIVLFVDTLLNKKGLLKHDLKLTRKGELVRLLQYSFVLVLVPIIMPIFGFYTTIVLSMLSILLLSKVRNIFIIALSLSGIILAIYLFLEKVSHTKLPTGLFI